jgi:hypothetical protein
MLCNRIINIPDCNNIDVDKINRINAFIQEVLFEPEETPEKTPEENVRDDKQELSQNEAMSGEDEEDEEIRKFQDEVNRRYERNMKREHNQKQWDKRPFYRKLIGIAKGENNPVSGELKKNLFGSKSNGGKSKRIRRKISRRKCSKKTRKCRSRQHKK